MKRERPLMIYDGDCGFCEASVARLRGITGERVEYRTSQDAFAEFPEIEPGDWAGSVQFIDTDGCRHVRSDAVFSALATSRVIGRLMVTASERVPGFRWVADAGYDLVARNRARLSRWMGREACGLDERR
jgi:predicted DCC family thiol-disulfide oxidoreductase YuxK